MSVVLVAATSDSETRKYRRGLLKKWRDIIWAAFFLSMRHEFSDYIKIKLKSRFIKIADVMLS